jgi:hypothetical protein
MSTSRSEEKWIYYKCMRRKGRIVLQWDEDEIQSKTRCRTLYAAVTIGGCVIAGVETALSYCGGASRGAVDDELNGMPEAVLVSRGGALGL